MPIYQFLSILFVWLITFSACQKSESTLSSSEKKEWIELFNGENLDGWDLKIRGYELNENFGNTFRIEDGLMKVRYDEYDRFENRFGHIFYKDPFSFYRLRVEYRFIGEQPSDGEEWAWRNNGIMFHSQSAASMGVDQDFPISLEYQLLGGDGENERTNGNLCTPGTHVVMDGELVEDHCISSSSGTHHGDQWVTAELLVYGDSLIQHILDDEVVLEYSKPQIGGGVVSGYDPDVKQDGKLVNSGYIALQSESHPTDIRSVRLLNLEGCMDPEAENFKSYYVSSDAESCIYDG